MEPEIAFATTYFYSFVRLICTAINSGQGVSINQRALNPSEMAQVRGVIVFPDNLERPVKEIMQGLSQQFSLTEAYIQCPDRTRVLWTLPNTLVLLDIPTILDTLPYTYPPLQSPNNITNRNAQALERFKQEITRLIAQDDISHALISIQSWDWLQERLL